MLDDELPLQLEDELVSGLNLWPGLMPPPEITLSIKADCRLGLGVATLGDVKVFTELLLEVGGAVVVLVED